MVYSTFLVSNQLRLKLKLCTDITPLPLRFESFTPWINDFFVQGRVEASSKATNLITLVYNNFLICSVLPLLFFSIVFLISLIDQLEKK